jgi:hypothetical protein
LLDTNKQIPDLDLRDHNSWQCKLSEQNPVRGIAKSEIGSERAKPGKRAFSLDLTHSHTLCAQRIQRMTHEGID